MDGNDIRGFVERICIDQPDTDFVTALLCQVLAPCDNIHFHSQTKFCNPFSQFPETKNAECFAVQAFRDMCLPAAIMHGPVFTGNFFEQVRNERNGVLGGRIGKHCCSTYVDAFCPCALHVDGKVAHTCCDKQLQIGQFFDQFGWEGCPLTHCHQNLKGLKCRGDVINIVAKMFIENGDFCLRSKCVPVGGTQ